MKFNSIGKFWVAAQNIIGLNVTTAKEVTEIVHSAAMDAALIVKTGIHITNTNLTLIVEKETGDMWISNHEASPVLVRMGFDAEKCKKANFELFFEAIKEYEKSNIRVFHINIPHCWCDEFRPEFIVTELADDDEVAIDLETGELYTLERVRNALEITNTVLFANIN